MSAAQVVITEVRPPHERKPMRRTTRFLLVLALLATAASSLPAPSHANGIVAAPVAAAGAGYPKEESWWGGAAAIGCGFGIRFWPAFGWNLGYNALLTVSCLMMIVDTLG